MLTVIELQAYLVWAKDMTVVECMSETLRSVLNCHKQEKSQLEIFVYFVYHNKKTQSKLGMAGHSCDHSMWEVEAGGSGTQKVILNYTVNLKPVWVTPDAILELRWQEQPQPPKCIYTAFLKKPEPWF